MTCDLCYCEGFRLNTHVQNGQTEMLCDGCLEWSEYWDILTPGERLRFHLLAVDDGAEP